MITGSGITRAYSADIRLVDTTLQFAEYLKILPPAQQPKKTKTPSKLDGDTAILLLYYPLTVGISLLEGIRYRLSDEYKRDQQDQKKREEYEQKEKEEFALAGIDTDLKMKAFHITYGAGLCLRRQIRRFGDPLPLKKDLFEQTYLPTSISDGISRLDGLRVNEDFKGKALEWLIEEIHLRKGTEFNFLANVVMKQEPDDSICMRVLHRENKDVLKY